MVKAYHHAGMEVILDVVYNHTAEGNNRGPTLSFKGIDNGAYYRLVDNDRRHYFDTTGTGNSLLMRSPHALQLITDSLRYWVTEMHVEDDFHAGMMVCLDHGFEFVDLFAALSGAGIRVVRGEEADGVVSPVVAQAFFLKEAVIDELVDGMSSMAVTPSFFWYSITEGYARPA